MTKSSFDRFVFLDFEASGLGPQSWPIELGVSWITPDLKVNTYANLIKPSVDWAEDGWSPASAAVHGILRHDLNTAPSVDVVARDFLTILGNRIALSDAPGFERVWLETLLEAAQLVNTVEIRDFKITMSQTFSSAVMDQLSAQKALGAAAHRAGADSKHMALLWLAGIQKSA